MGDTQPHKMNRLVKQVYIYTDSRGRWLNQELQLIRDEGIAFHVTSLSGAGLERLWERAEFDLLNRRVDLVILFGGICNLTDPYYDQEGNRQFWPPFNMDERFKEVETLIRDISQNHLLLNLHAKLCFIQEPGCDLILYNRIRHPVPPPILICQEVFEKNLRVLQKVIREVNNHSNSPTPWALQITHDLRAGQWIPVYHRLYDGLHPTNRIVQKYARVLLQYSRHVLWG